MWIKKLIVFFKEKTILHTSLIGMFFVLYGYNEMYESVDAEELLVAAIIFILLPSIVVIGLKKYTLTPIRYAVILTLCLFVTLFEAHLIFAINEFAPAYLQIRRRYWLLIVLILVVIAFYLSKNKKMIAINYYLNLLTLLYVGIESAKAVYHSLNTPYQTASLPNIPLQAVNSQTPDIYLIVVDAYTGTESLKKYWQYDNSLFLDSMKKMNYYEIKNAKTNYNKTIYSIATLLNSQYILTDLSSIDKTRSDEVLSYFHIKHNKAMTWLRQAGYETINLSFFKIQDNPPFLPFKSTYIISYFNVFLLNKTSFGHIFEILNFLWIDSKNTGKAQRISKPIDTFKQLVATPSPQPRFVYLHLLCPHPPFEFDKNGNLWRASMVAQHSTEQLYLEQLQYVNTLLFGMAKHIEKTARRPYITLITGDHGAKIFEDAAKKRQESHTTTTLFKFPDNNYDILYDSMSTVNLFRPILHKALKQPLDYLPDTIVNH
jgi:hypothetical protein